MTEASQEIQTRRSFREIVLETQKKWRESKRPAYKEFSQAVDLPEKVTGKLVDTVLNNMPDFIPAHVKENIKRTHPDPIVAAGVLPDRRFFKDEYEVKLEKPSWISDEDTKDYQNGMVLLNEITTDTLATEVEEKMAKKNLWSRITGGIRKVTDKMFKYPHNKNIKKAEKILGGKEKFEDFRKKLVVAMLTGDKTEVDAQLGESGYQDLDRFALEIGREASYSKGLEWLTKILKSERLAMIITGGHVDRTMPGIVSVNLGYTTPSVANIAAVAYETALFATGFYAGLPTLASVMFGVTAVNGGWLMIYGSAIKHSLIHETVHYLSQDSVDRMGLLNSTATKKT